MRSPPYKGTQYSYLEGDVTVHSSARFLLSGIEKNCESINYSH